MSSVHEHHTVMVERYWNLLTSTPTNWDWTNDLDMNWCKKGESDMNMTEHEQLRVELEVDPVESGTESVDWKVRSNGNARTIIGPGLFWPSHVICEIQKVMDEGEAAGKHGWELRPVEYHVDRALVHLAQYGHDRGEDHKEDRGEDHLAHAFTRLMMACAIERGYVNKDMIGGVNVNQRA